MLAEDGHFKECAEGKEDTEKSLLPERKEVDCWESHCMSSFSCCSDRISDQKQSQEEGFILAPRVRGFNPSWQGSHGNGGLRQLGTLHPQSRCREWLYSAHFPHMQAKGWCHL